MMNILYINKAWADGCYWADGLFDGVLKSPMFRKFTSVQKIVDEVNSPYYPIKIDKIVLNRTALTAQAMKDETLGGEVIMTNQVSLREFFKRDAA